MSILSRKLLTCAMAGSIFTSISFPAPAYSSPLRRASETVNAVIGDRSFVSAFGHLPDADTDNHLRIQTHLNYVIRTLKERTPLTISPIDYPQRHLMISLLEKYAAEGRFPQQFAYGGRRPLFEDAKGNVCAVGYLVQQTAGQILVSQIREKWAYAYLPAIKNQALQRWAQHSGLTETELATIQPTYGGTSNFVPLPAPELEPPAYGPVLYGLHAAQAALFAGHIYAFQLEPEVYKPYQAADILLTLGIPLGSLFFLGLDEANSLGYTKEERSLHVHSMLGLLVLNFITLFGLNLINTYKERNNALTLGYIPVAYGQAAGVSYEMRF